MHSPGSCSLRFLVPLCILKSEAEINHKSYNTINVKITNFNFYLLANNQIYPILFKIASAFNAALEIELNTASKLFKLDSSPLIKTTNKIYTQSLSLEKDDTNLANDPF